MKMLLKEILNKLGFEIKKIDRRVASLKTENGCRGNVLLSYILDPFLLKNGEPIPNTHFHFWESVEIAKTFLGLGYNVDIIDYSNDMFIPKKEYAVFIDARWNMERLAPLINKDCIKVMHIDVAHSVFYGFSELKRLLELQRRRGITLRTRRVERINKAIEHADCAVIYGTNGNDFTLNTFKYAGKPLYRVPMASLIQFPFFDTREIENCQKRFLWFASHNLWANRPRTRFCKCIS
jgi:hypothetical protein